MNKKAVLFTGGLGPDKDKVSKIIDNAEITVAADSGWDLALGMNVIPDYFIGDMDSVSDCTASEKLTPDRIMRFPVDKDFTDTELALKFLADKNYRGIVLVGGGGGRIDHLLALNAVFGRKIRPSEWFTEEEHIIYSECSRKIECRTGQTVSFFAAGNEAVISTKGMKWELEKFQLDSVSFSLSNTAEGSNFYVEVYSGSLLIILNY